MNKFASLSSVLALSFGLGMSAASAATSSNGFDIADKGLGFKIISTGGDIVATFIGADASFYDTLVFENTNTQVFVNNISSAGSTVNLGYFEAGVELSFRLDVFYGFSEWVTNDLAWSVYTGNNPANPDGELFARAESNYGSPNTTLVSFEDWPNTDWDYNDISFSFTQTEAVPSTPEIPAVPVPAAGFLLVGGIAALGALKRRRTN